MNKDFDGAEFLRGLYGFVNFVAEVNEFLLADMQARELSFCADKYVAGWDANRTAWAVEMKRTAELIPKGIGPTQGE